MRELDLQDYYQKYNRQTTVIHIYDMFVKDLQNCKYTSMPNFPQTVTWREYCRYDPCGGY